MLMPAPGAKSYENQWTARRKQRTRTVYGADVFMLSEAADALLGEDVLRIHASPSSILSLSS